MEPHPNFFHSTTAVFMHFLASGNLTFLLLFLLLKPHVYSIFFIMVAVCVNQGKSDLLLHTGNHEDWEEGYTFHSCIPSVSSYQWNNSRANGNETIECVSVKLGHLLSHKWYWEELPCCYLYATGNKKAEMVTPICGDH